MSHQQHPQHPHRTHHTSTGAQPSPAGQHEPTIESQQQQPQMQQQPQVQQPQVQQPQAQQPHAQQQQEQSHAQPHAQQQQEQSHAQPHAQQQHRREPTTAQLTPPFHEAQEQQFPGSEAQMEPQPDFGERSYRGSGKLVNQVAVITGGDSGIGRAVALAFAREGCDVAISYLNEHDDAKLSKRMVESAGRKCILIPGDISKDEQCKKIIDMAVGEFGHIDILVNNAAFQGKAVSDITQLDRERVEFTFATNIMSMFSLCRYAVPHIRAGGSIINVASIQAYDPSASILDYATTKGAIVTFTKGLAAEMLSKNIRCNCVAPGPVWTPLVAASFRKEKLKEFGSKYPIGRPAQPAELAPCFVFLASPESMYVNAEVLGVTGGVPLA